MIKVKLDNDILKLILDIEKNKNSLDISLFRYLLCLSTYLPIYRAKRVIKY